jgi:aryl-alcohol dehydrogenase
MLNVIQPTPDMTVAVVGVGVVGLSAIMALKMLENAPRKIIAIDIVSSRLEMARKHGATHGVNSKYRPDLMAVLMDITEGRGVDGSIDTTGKPEVIKGLINGAARKGKVVTVGVGDVCAALPELSKKYC